MNTKLIIHTTLILFAFVSAKSSAEITVRAPEQTKNGRLIPFDAYFSPALSEGETATVQVEGKQAAQLNVIEGRVTSFGTRIQMSQSGDLVIERWKSGSRTESHRKSIVVENGGFASGSPSVINKSVGKERIEPGSYSAIFASENGFGNVLVLQDAGFKVEVVGSNMVSKNPYVGIKGGFSEKVTSSFIEKPSEAPKPMVEPVNSGNDSLETRQVQVSGKIYGERMKIYHLLGKTPCYVKRTDVENILSAITMRNLPTINWSDISSGRTLGCDGGISDLRFTLSDEWTSRVRSMASNLGYSGNISSAYLALTGDKKHSSGLVRDAGTYEFGLPSRSDSTGDNGFVARDYFCDISCKGKYSVGENGRVYIGGSEQIAREDQAGRDRANALVERDARDRQALKDYVTHDSNVKKNYACRLKCRTSGILHDMRDLGTVIVPANNPIERERRLSEICGQLNPGSWYVYSDECK